MNPPEVTNNISTTPVQEEEEEEDSNIPLYLFTVPKEWTSTLIMREQQLSRSRKEKKDNFNCAHCKAPVTQPYPNCSECLILKDELSFWSFYDSIKTASRGTHDGLYDPSRSNFSLAIVFDGGAVTVCRNCLESKYTPCSECKNNFAEYDGYGRMSDDEEDYGSDDDCDEEPECQLHYHLRK